MGAGAPGFLDQMWPPARTPFFAPTLAPPSKLADARKNFPLAGRVPSAAVIGTIIVLHGSGLRIISQMGLLGLIELVSPISPVSPICPIHAFHFCERR